MNPFEYNRERNNQPSWERNERQPLDKAKKSKKIGKAKLAKKRNTRSQRRS